MGVDKVVDERPLQTRAHAGVHPETGAGQLGAAFIVDHAQLSAQVHMVLGLEIELVGLAKVAQRLVVLLAAGFEVGIGQVGQ